MVNSSHNALSAIARMAPPPQRRRQPKGPTPSLTPNFVLFLMRDYGHAPRGEGRQTRGARGSITNQYFTFTGSGRCGIEINPAILPVNTLLRYRFGIFNIRETNHWIDHAHHAPLHRKGQPVPF
jgi:hypothetical protein